jgi:hypothetical protein
MAFSTLVFALGQSSSQQTQQRLAVQREALERTEREMRARQAEQLRQAEEWGNQQRREQSEAERKKEVRQREEEWRAVLQTRQQPHVEVEQSLEKQQRTPLTEPPQSIVLTTSPNPAEPIFARLPLRRLGLALFAAAIVFTIGWSLIPALSARAGR